MACLEARDRKFFLKGKEIVLLSGAMHYFRIVPEYWRDRLLRLKAAGLNCVETYVPWNWHEEVKGEFNFEGMLDIRKYIQLAQELDLYVLLRPGPYICSEWDFGGLPSWLLADPEMKVRSSYQPYLDAVDRYFSELLPRVADLQMSKGGPIIAVQIENEYGSYGDDKVYKEFLRDNVKKYGISELLFTSDNGVGIQVGEVEGELITANFQEKEHGYLMFEYLKNVKQPGRPLMVMEFWTGWFDHWGEKHHVWPLKEFVDVLSWILDQGSSVNFYMFHGGTNWGFMSGANEGLGATNEGGGTPYGADVTSYDYDAPVAENGDLQEKFYRIRDILQKKLPWQVVSEPPDPPAAIPSVAYDTVPVTSHLTFDDLLKCVEPIKSQSALTMEQLPINNGGGQGYGMILYRTTVPQGKMLSFKGKVADRATVILNGKEETTVDWLQNNHTHRLYTSSEDNCLDILVENLGRVNYAEFKSGVLNDQRKGLRGEVSFDGKKLEGWSIYPLEFNKKFVEKLSSSTDWQTGPVQQTSPAVFKVILQVQDQPKDTYIHMEGWKKGFVFVNGVNLGRYWDIGPQETLYLPAPLLKSGENEILVVELHRGSGSLSFVAKPILGEVVIHKTIMSAMEKAKVLGLKTILSMGNWTWGLLKHFMK